MKRPVLLDLYCGAGGAAAGYHRAGFDVVGVDIEPMPRYPFPFCEGDALERLDWLLNGRRLRVDAIHASPPCQDHSRMNPAAIEHGTGHLLADTREALKATGLPWIIENVPGSGLAQQTDLLGTNGLLLCGAMFGAETYRHRLFESSIPLAAPWHPRHLTPASAAGHWEPGTYISVTGNCAPIAAAREVMDIGWMTRDELAQAIPPYFTRYIGTQIIEHLTGIRDAGAAA
jgi:DNA (cytosine-5)-methyltransferase 1